MIKSQKGLGYRHGPSHWTPCRRQRLPAPRHLKFRTKTSQSHPRQRQLVCSSDHRRRLVHVGCGQIRCARHGVADRLLDSRQGGPSDGRRRGNLRRKSRMVPRRCGDDAQRVHLGPRDVGAAGAWDVVFAKFSHTGPTVRWLCRRGLRRPYDFLGLSLDGQLWSTGRAISLLGSGNLRSMLDKTQFQRVVVPDDVRFCEKCPSGAAPLSLAPRTACCTAGACL